MKVCSTCKAEKPLAEFGRNNRSPDGLCAACKACRNARNDPEYARRYYEANREKFIQRSALAKQTNGSDARYRSKPEVKARQREYNRDYRGRNAMKLKVTKAEWAKLPHARERKRLWSAEYTRKYPGKHAARENARRAGKLRATPAWADVKLIEDLYWLAATYREARGEEYHVDHIVPMRSRLVCGLHVPDNLQILPAPENLKKGNHWWPGHPAKG